MPFFLFAAACPPARLCRTLSLRFLAGLIVEITPAELRARVIGLPLCAQVPLIGILMVTLGLATLVFAHAGWGGPVAFWITLAALSR